MGSSVSSCLHPSSSAPKRQILVLKNDGLILTFKEGSHVRDVLVAHPSHHVISRCSDRTQLPATFRLSCNHLYFLQPKGAAAAAAAASYDESVERLLRRAASRDPTLLFVVSGDTKGPDNNKHVLEDNYGRAGKAEKEIKSRWKPTLQTIPEVTLSELLNADHPYPGPGGQL